jgi:hypothetical protein
MQYQVRNNWLGREDSNFRMAESKSAALPFEYGGVKYDRMQLLTIKDILEDKREFHTPTNMVSRVSTAQGSLAL